MCVCCVRGTSVTRRVKYRKHKIEAAPKNKSASETLGDSRGRPVSLSRLLEWREAARLIGSGDILKWDAPRISKDAPKIHELQTLCKALLTRCVHTVCGQK